MALRVFASGSGLRGAGLGNEAIAWAKSYICARELGAEMLPPQWALNRYGLPRDLGLRKTRLAAAQAVTSLAKRTVVTEAMYRSTGVDDYGEALKILSARGELPSSGFLETCGMWGGYLSIRSAAPFLRQKVLTSPGVLQVQESLPFKSNGIIHVAVHVRQGDFSPTPPRPGEFNKAIEISWYRNVIKYLIDVLGTANLAISILSDGSGPSLESLTNFTCVERVKGTTVVQDLSIMMSADLLVCSNSSLSMLAAFLSGNPYLWYYPSLISSGQRLSIWGLEPGQLAPDSPTRRAMSHSDGSNGGRGMSVGREGALDPALIAGLQEEARRRFWKNDLLMYGVVGDKEERR